MLIVFCVFSVTLRPVILAEAVSFPLPLISRLCACVVRYVGAGWEVDRHEGREAITLLLLLLRFHCNLMYCNYHTLLEQQTFSLRSKTALLFLKCIQETFLIFFDNFWLGQLDSLNHNK